MRIRRAVAADGPAVGDLMVRARLSAAAAGTIPCTAHPPEDIRAWASTTMPATDEVWLAEDDGTPVGLLALGHADWLHHLYLDPDRTGEGIGTLLLGHAKRLRPGGLQLWAFQSNAGALRFYQRHGFVAVERTDGATNEERAPDVRYEWRPEP